MLIRHHLKSELQIGKENAELSSDSTSTPLSSSPNQIQTQFSIQVSPFSSSSHHPPASSNPPPSLCNHERFSNNPSPSRTPPRSSPNKRTRPNRPSLVIPFGSKFLTLKILTLFRFLIFLPLPSLYFLVSSPSLLDFLFVLSFSAALLISFNLALPRLPSIRLFLARSLPLKLSSSSNSSQQPVLWSIGSKPENVKGLNSGSWVQVYGNGDVYEGEFHKGKCSGSGVYHYHMSGRYEGDWVDGEYDGYGVETWARGSRYRGQYRQGLRHGIGIYRFYGGDVYAGEWSNGQCHGFGIHTCSDGSRYAGEFKWGVKHGIGQYHFR